MFLKESQLKCKLVKNENALTSVPELCVSRVKESCCTSCVLSKLEKLTYILHAIVTLFFSCGVLHHI